jgi:hypothetical protein
MNCEPEDVSSMTNDAAKSMMGGMMKGLRKMVKVPYKPPKMCKPCSKCECTGKFKLGCACMEEIPGKLSSLNPESPKAKLIAKRDGKQEEASEKEATGEEDEEALTKPKSKVMSAKKIMAAYNMAKVSPAHFLLCI